MEREELWEEPGPGHRAIPEGVVEYIRDMVSELLTSSSSGLGMLVQGDSVSVTTLAAGMDPERGELICDRLQENRAQRQKNFFFALTHSLVSRY